MLNLVNQGELLGSPLLFVQMLTSCSLLIGKDLSGSRSGYMIVLNRDFLGRDAAFTTLLERFIILVGWVIGMGDLIGYYDGILLVRRACLL
jgi:hypothetical protein